MSLTRQQRAQLAEVAAQMLHHADVLRRVFAPSVVYVRVTATDERWTDDETTEIGDRPRLSGAADR